MLLKKIINCARCGENHINITAKPLSQPVFLNDEVLYTHWAPCPTNGEPILVVEMAKDGSITIDTNTDKEGA